MSDYEPERLSAFERRRRAPFHFLGRADNARFAAYVLARGLNEAALTVAASDAGYGGSAQIATDESFRREAYIALELIIKAVIAQRLEVGETLHQVTKVPLHHKLVQLWSDAVLPRLGEEDFGRLVYGEVALQWSSRYPAPKTDDEGMRDDKRIWKLAMKRVGGLSIDVRRHVPFEWEDLDRIYSIAHREFGRIREESNFYPVV